LTNVVRVESKNCPECGKHKVFEVSSAALVRYLEGAHVQVAFPEMSVDDRERFISGICPRCWNKIFPDE
jgi:hypothetical protein